MGIGYHHQFLALMRRFDVSRKLPYILSLLAIMSGIATYWSLSRTMKLGEENYSLTLIYVDLTILLLLAVVIARRLVELWTKRRLGQKGSKLHVHIVALFAFVSVTPAIFVALFSAHFLNSGVNAWFGKPVEDALKQARVISDSYLNEHKKTIKFDAQSLVNKYSSMMPYLAEHPEELSERLNEEADFRNLSEILIFNGDKQPRILGRSYLTFSPMLEDLRVHQKEAETGEFVNVDAKNRVRVIVKLDPITNTYLFIGKMIDPAVLNHIDLTRSSIKDYSVLKSKHSELQLTFVLFFLIVALLMLMAAIWMGLAIADLMVRPITKLIAAAQSVAEGDLTIKLESQALNNEIDDLCSSFNRMTHQLLQQKQDLILSEKKSAWADMARKIAHEIKNPLTPIQLSAERLKRRYLKEITTDPETFKACIDTIIRQVGSIESLVTEFSNFARMPEPKLEEIDWVNLCQQSLFLQSQAHPDIDFELSSAFKNYKAFIDPLQMSQVLMNLLQNAINAIKESGNTLQQSKIKLRLYEKNLLLYVAIDDNGPGFPEQGMAKLMEPYYTTRERGTGLGLAIVSKIVSDHNGRIELMRSLDLGGASVVLSFPIKEINEKVAYDVI